MLPSNYQAIFKIMLCLLGKFCKWPKYKIGSRLWLQITTHNMNDHGNKQAKHLWLGSLSKENEAGVREFPNPFGTLVEFGNLHLLERWIIGFPKKAKELTDGRIHRISSGMPMEKQRKSRGGIPVRRLETSSRCKTPNGILEDISGKTGIPAKPQGGFTPRMSR